MNSLSNKPSFAQLLRNPVQLFAFGFGSGLSPKAPGTAGTVVAVPLYFLIAQLSLPIYSTVVLIAAVVGIYLCGKTADDMQVHDHGSIVWDEVAGMFITFLFVPITAPSLLAGFVLFRIFDILKPWPIGPIDKRLHGGTGIMLDDIVAGAMACACLHIMMMMWPAFTTLF